MARQYEKEFIARISKGRTVREFIIWVVLILSVIGESMTRAAKVARIPFYDPEKARTHQ